MLTPSPQGFAASFDGGAVAADHATASRAGALMLEQGGNAVDAAVAAAFTLSVVRPYSCGIGGGGFLVLHFPDGHPQGARSVALDYRERAPAGVTSEWYLQPPRAGDPDAATHGGAAVAVPSTVQGLLAALEQHGTFPREKILGPAIAAAHDGFAVDGHYVESVAEVLAWFARDPAARAARFPFMWERFLRRGEVKAGDQIKLPEQGRALELIAAQGAAAMTSGPIAAAILQAVRRDGGVLTAEDLASARVRQSSPLRGSFGDRTVLGMPLPSAGGVAIAQALGIIAALGDMFTRYPHGSPQRLHLVAEALRAVFADRARWLDDAAFAAVPLAALLEPANLAAIAGRIDPARALAPAECGSRLDSPGLPAGPGGGGTSHLCAADRFGGVVACTETVNLIFGSLLVAEPFGFVLNNEMDDFETRPAAAGMRNLPGPGRCPLSSMCPTIVLDGRGRPEIVAGASGGPRIVSSTLQVLLGAMERGPSLGEVLLRPRLHHQWKPDLLQLERGLQTPDISGVLARLGHNTEGRDPIGAVQVIRARAAAGSSPGGWEAACDPRKGGLPAGI